MPPTPHPAEIRRALQSAVLEAKAPGAVLYVGDLDRDYLLQAIGFRELEPYRRTTREDTLYDLASLTKVVATLPAVMKLRDAGHFSLTDSIADYVPIPAFRPMTIENLLTHTSGLVPFEHYYLTMDSLDDMLMRYAAEGIDNPPDVLHSYSDVGFMLLGKLVELTAHDTLDAYCRREIFEPLGMTRTTFNPPEAWRGNCAATENDPWRGRVMRGEVHDQNAWAVGGVSGHAGLFSDAADLATFCRAFLRGEVVPESTVDEILRFNRKPLYPWQGLAWQIDPWSSKATGFLPSRTAFGHTGWTGTSIWMDRINGLFVVLLSNTCHPSREKRDNDTLRRVVHVAVGKQFYDTSNTHSGLDRLVRENFTAIEKKRFALLTNLAAVDELGRSILDVVGFARETDLVYLYSPEHGLRGQAEAGERVGDQSAPVPVISLYGQRKSPSRDELTGLDLFMIDLQDVGARYYTYMATMFRCLNACAEAGVPVLVLDRPNPLGGEILEGPIATDTSSLVSSAAIPIRHGMTMGELALWYQRNELADRQLDLTVNWLDNWPPRRLFSECHLPWVPPSPNLPTPNSALLYVGMCLFEATNLNEGRGTETPFEVIGAPWLDSAKVIRSVHPFESVGAELEPVYYVPKSISGKAAHPRYEGQTCSGVRIHIREPHRIRPFTLAVSLIVAIQRVHPDEFALDGSPSLDTLAGGPDLRQRIEAGHSALTIAQHYADALREFDASRPRLYDPDGIPIELLKDGDEA